ncbi:IS3 family transposase [Mycobacterium attenuatum]|uniref:IS3 family transposase n=1 Tax=Mycobacterium attenuatum TaxID=2341086 RepID=UPI003CC7EF16
MAEKYTKYKPEFRDEIAKLIVESGRLIVEVAREYGLNETTVGGWVKKYRAEHAGDEPSLELSERARLRELERRTRELEIENAFLKKGSGALREGATMSDKFEFIDAERAYTAGEAPQLPTVARMCALLQVSKSGYYEWRDRPQSLTQQRRERLADKIGVLFTAFGATYGYRRIHAELLRAGERVGDELVRKLMRELDLVAVQPKPYRRTTIAGEAWLAAPDLVKREFTAEKPGAKLVGDITYIPTWQGWLYLATVIDCFNKEVIGYSMADHMRTELVTDALDMAARNHVLQPGCIMHSDRGAQYTSADYVAKLGELGLSHSLGRTGVCWDNALAESFFASLKNERVHHMVYATRKSAKEDIARYIELFYNHKRIHSALGYRTPHEVRTEYLNSQLAA